MPDWMVFCRTCGRYSTRVYRCNVVVGENSDGEPVECGADLASSGTPVEPFRYRTVAGTRDDGLVEVKFRRICVECGAERFVGIHYDDVGLVIRYPCVECEAPTKHRPVDEDLRYRVRQLGFGDVDGDDSEQTEQRDDHTSVPMLPP